ncbi:HAD family hydrolase [Halorubellus sp. PRR65]|uniref:HAD family hydrolase n=1 Tax=Halorubellus sp. PRR65 TaxID=3098148 RepID=UPI002B25EA77|nr:HAD family hydrolase [Halorubellus sp. PRR65]
MAVSFDLFGTLVDVTRSDDPAAAVARELRARDVDVPEDWGEAYREVHVDAPEGAEVPLPAHVARALASRGVAAPGNAPRRAVVAAFDPDVTVRRGARDAVAAASEHGPVAVCSNCAVPGLVRTTLVRADMRDAFDAVVASAACGWRKPDARIFERAADAVECEPRALVHVGDSDADAGVERLGGHFVDVRRVATAELADVVGSLAASTAVDVEESEAGDDPGERAGAGEDAGRGSR